MLILVSSFICLFILSLVFNTSLVNSFFVFLVMFFVIPQNLFFLLFVPLATLSGQPLFLSLIPITFVFLCSFFAGFSSGLYARFTTVITTILSF